MTQDLLGDWSLITVWGGLGSARGGQRTQGVASEAEGQRRLAALDKRRRQRGYQPVGEPLPGRQPTPRRSDGRTGELDLGG